MTLRLSFAFQFLELPQVEVEGRAPLLTTVYCPLSIAFSRCSFVIVSSDIHCRPEQKCGHLQCSQGCINIGLFLFF